MLVKRFSRLEKMIHCKGELKKIVQNNGTGAENCSAEKVKRMISHSRNCYKETEREVERERERERCRLKPII